ncbi:type I-MYXAN CRISPR-associated Cas8a1/Cmx1 [Chamaesiphon sp. VAR_48_metabat_135_sub]|uniref:type I-MYXAN CRISPR-associated Cas8a1/Cmx1 n=1 Tax=Chamaesiphon sp. VAR_48_metabat_135_sub TaxID=2964699 RepID=UPI00286A441B|nr:type I-MYXAN CRISPR-associated Cas8a1/Cmx1 [Chamaesiphon sp. VAR_48_metabat_135_sub]
MSKFTLSLLDPNTLLPHRAGIAGLALALSTIDPQAAPFTWEITEDAVHLAWEGTDRDAVQWLLSQTYQIQDGYLHVPALKLDLQSRYTFTEGLKNTLLQHNQQRSLEKNSTSLSFSIEPGKPEITLKFRKIIDCYYTQDFADCFNKKGEFKKEHSLKSQHLPGLDECFVNGVYKESSIRFFAMLFLPLACSYYQLPNYGSALVIPDVIDLVEWVKQRQESSGQIVERIKAPYADFCASSAGGSALRFLLREKIIAGTQTLSIRYCEAYQLGKQSWNKQNYVKQAVYRVEVKPEILELYDIAEQLFPSKVTLKTDGEYWLAPSNILPWISENLVRDKPWYLGFYEFRKRYKLYERKGLVDMTTNTNCLGTQEQILFDAVQGSFGVYLSNQFSYRKDSLGGRDLNKKEAIDVFVKSTEKVIYRLQANTQHGFAKALVKFLSDFPSKTSRGMGAEIYSLLYTGNSWRQARDLALLAVATYKSKKGDALDGQEISIESSPDLETEDSTFEMEL